MAALLLFAVLAQTPSREESPWRTRWTDGAGCIRVTLEDGTEEEQCPKPGHGDGTVPVDQTEANPVVACPADAQPEWSAAPDSRKAQMLRDCRALARAATAPPASAPIFACPADADPHWSEASDAQKAQMLRDCRALATPAAAAVPRAAEPASGARLSRFGFVGNVVVKLDEPGQGNGLKTQGYAIQTRVGLRYGLLERSSRGNVAVGLLVGGGFANDHGTLGVDARIEGMYAARGAPLMPIVMGYLTSGATFSPDTGYAAEFHLGVGGGWNALTTGLLPPLGAGEGLSGFRLGNDPFSAVIFVVVAVAVATVVVAMMSNAELRYTLRTDGTHFGSIVFGVGI